MVNIIATTMFAASCRGRVKSLKMLMYWNFLGDPKNTVEIIAYKFCKCFFKRYAVRFLWHMSLSPFLNWHVFFMKNGKKVVSTFIHCVFGTYQLLIYMSVGFWDIHHFWIALEPIIKDLKCQDRHQQLFFVQLLVFLRLFWFMRILLEKRSSFFI